MEKNYWCGRPHVVGLMLTVVAYESVVVVAMWVLSKVATLVIVSIILIARASNFFFYPYIFSFLREDHSYAIGCILVFVYFWCLSPKLAYSLD